MVSDASKKKAAAKKAAAAAKRGGKAAAAAASAKAAAQAPNGVAAENLTEGFGSIELSDRTCTGVLASHPLSRDIHVSFCIFLYSISCYALGILLNFEVLCCRS